METHLPDTSTPERPVAAQERKQPSRARLCGLVISLLINAVCPYFIYTALKRETHVSEMTALVATGVPSLLDAGYGIAKRRRLDFMAGVVLFSIAVGLGLIALGGSPRLYLVRESLFTASYGLAMLISLLFSKPLGFYTGRYFMTGNDPDAETQFDAAWSAEWFRGMIRAQTVIWGIGTVLEAVLRVYLAYTLPVPRFLVISPLVFYGYMGLTMLVSTFSAHRWRMANDDTDEDRPGAQSPRPV